MAKAKDSTSAEDASVEDSKTAAEDASVEDSKTAAEQASVANSVNLAGVVPGTSTTLPDGTVITHY